MKLGSQTKNILPFLDENSEKITSRRFRQYMPVVCLGGENPFEIKEQYVVSS